MNKQRYVYIHIYVYIYIYIWSIGRTDAEAEAPILWLPNAKSQLIEEDPDAGKDRRWEEKGTTEDEMVGWHHRLKGPEFEQALGDGEGQGSLSGCVPWGCRVRHDLATEQQYLRYIYIYIYTYISNQSVVQLKVTQCLLSNVTKRKTNGGFEEPLLFANFLSKRDFFVYKISFLLSRNLHSGKD